jgi:CRP/FNR family transcriptional regulator
MEKLFKEVYSFTKYMDKEDLDYLLSTIRYRTAESGTIITGEGGRCTGIPFVLDGVLRFFKVSEAGREMTLHRVLPGEPCIMAAICVLGSLKYDFSVEIQKKSKLAIVSPETFKTLMDRSEAFKTFIFQVLANKLVSSIDTIEMVNFISIEQRILSYLQQNVDEKRVLKTTHENIAIELGSTREVISRNLGKLQKRGVVELKRGHIKLIE